MPESPTPNSSDPGQEASKPRLRLSLNKKSKGDDKAPAEAPLAPSEKSSEPDKKSSEAQPSEGSGAAPKPRMSLGLKSAKPKEDVAPATKAQPESEPAAPKKLGLGIKKTPPTEPAGEEESDELVSDAFTVEAKPPPAEGEKPSPMKLGLKQSGTPAAGALETPPAEPAAAESKAEPAAKPKLTIGGAKPEATPPAAEPAAPKPAGGAPPLKKAGGPPGSAPSQPSAPGPPKQEGGPKPPGSPLKGAPAPPPGGGSAPGPPKPAGGPPSPTAKPPVPAKRPSASQAKEEKKPEEVAEEKKSSIVGILKALVALVMIGGLCTIVISFALKKWKSGDAPEPESKGIGALVTETIATAEGRAAEADAITEAGMDQGAAATPQLPTKPASTPAIPEAVIPAAPEAPAVAQEAGPADLDQSQIAAFVGSLNISAIRPPRAMINNRLYRPNDIVNEELGLRFLGIDTQRSRLVFADAQGKRHYKEF